MGGCIIMTYDAHTSDSNQSGLVRSEPITYQLIFTGADDTDRHYSKIAEAVFNRHGLAAKEVTSLDNAAKQHLVMKISLPTRREASGQEMLGAITLFLIPVATTRKSYYEYEMTLLEDKQVKDTHRVALDETSYTGVIFVPFFWINAFTTSKLDREFEKALETEIGKTRVLSSPKHEAPKS